MRLDIFVLILGYVLSQFYRAFLAVLAPVLGRELGVTASDLALSSGLWFFSFAVMQIPVGIALDRIGPRATASVLLALGGAGGAMVFALAEGPVAIHVAMVMIGVGCSPVLMASYFIFARLVARGLRNAGRSDDRLRVGWATPRRMPRLHFWSMPSAGVALRLAATV